MLRELQRQNELKQDFIGPAQSFVLEPDGRTCGIIHRNTGDKEIFGTNDFLHRQVEVVLNILAKYYDAMKEQKPDLLGKNINAWFADRD